jgi:hypothetical protein
MNVPEDCMVLAPVNNAYLELDLPERALSYPEAMLSDLYFVKLQNYSLKVSQDERLNCNEC